jgi:hypothetical protein
MKITYEFLAIGCEEEIFLYLYKYIYIYINRFQVPSVRY